MTPYTLDSHVVWEAEDDNPIRIGWMYYYSLDEAPYAYLYKVIAQNDKFVVIHEQKRGTYWGYVDDTYSRPIFVDLSDFKKKAVRKVN
jgi:hypothetical protein